MAMGSLPGVSWAAAGGPFTPLQQNWILWSTSTPERPSGVSEASQCAGGSLSVDGSQSVGARWGWPLALRLRTSGDSAPAHLPPSTTAVGGQRCRQSGQRQHQCSRNPARQQRPVPHCPLCAAVGAALAAARDSGTGRGSGCSSESSQSGSTSPGGGRRTAWLAVPAAGLRQPRRAAPPLIVAALAEVTIGGCPAGPHCGTRTHRSGAQTMRSESRAVAPARLSRELTGWPSGLTPAPCPVAPASGPALAADPSPWDALPRAPASLCVRSPSGTSVRQGAWRQCATGRIRLEPSCFAAGYGAVPSTSPRVPLASPLSSPS